MSERIDISDMMTDKFYADKKNIYKGKVLIFDFEGSPTHLKIVRLNRSAKKCEVEEVHLVTPEEAEQVWEDVRNV